MKVLIHTTFTTSMGYLFKDPIYCWQVTILGFYVLNLVCLLEFKKDRHPYIIGKNEIATGIVSVSTVCAYVPEKFSNKS